MSHSTRNVFGFVRMTRALSVNVRNFWVHSHFHVAAAAVILYDLYADWSGIQVLPNYGAFLFCATVAYYGFLRLHHIRSLRPSLRQWFRQHYKFVLFLVLSSFFCGIWSYFRLPVSMRLRLLIPGILALFYHLRPARTIISLRNTGMLKIGVISAVWAAIVTWVPMGDNFSLFWKLVWFMHAFLFVLLWTVPFDIRDLSLDEGDLKTIPLVFREKTFSRILVPWSLYMGLSIFLAFRFSVSAGIVFLAGGGMLLAAVYYARRFRHRYFFTAFWVEGIPVWMWLIRECLNYVG